MSRVSSGGISFSTQTNGTRGPGRFSKSITLSTGRLMYDDLTVDPEAAGGPGQWSIFNSSNIRVKDFDSNVTLLDLDYVDGNGNNHKTLLNNLSNGDEILFTSNEAGKTGTVTFTVSAVTDLDIFSFDIVRFTGTTTGSITGLSDADNIDVNFDIGGVYTVYTVGTTQFNTDASAAITDALGAGVIPVEGDVATITYTTLDGSVYTLNGIHDGTGVLDNDWTSFAIEIDGSLLVSDSVVADSLNVNAVTSKIVRSGKVSVNDVTNPGYYFAEDGKFIAGAGSSGANISFDGSDLSVGGVSGTDIFSNSTDYLFGEQVHHGGNLYACKTAVDAVPSVTKEVQVFTVTTGADPDADATADTFDLTFDPEGLSSQRQTLGYTLVTGDSTEATLAGHLKTLLETSVFVDSVTISGDALTVTFVDYAGNVGDITIRNATGTATSVVRTISTSSTGNSNGHLPPSSKWDALLGSPENAGARVEITNNAIRLFNSDGVSVIEMVSS